MVNQSIHEYLASLFPASHPSLRTLRWSGPSCRSWKAVRRSPPTFPAPLTCCLRSHPSTWRLVSKAMHVLGGRGFGGDGKRDGAQGGYRIHAYVPAIWYIYNYMVSREETPDFSDLAKSKRHIPNDSWTPKVILNPKDPHWQPKALQRPCQTKDSDDGGRDVGVQCVAGTKMRRNKHTIETFCYRWPTIYSWPI